MITLKHCGIEIENHIYQSCYDCYVDICDDGDVERDSGDDRKRKNMTGLGYPRIHLKLGESAPSAIEEVFPVVTGTPKRQPQHLPEKLHFQNRACR
jgi:hypothetical protein